MARVRRPEPVEPEQPQGPVMPLDVVFNFGSDDSRPEFHESRVEWLREHGIDPDDRTAVRAVVAASQRAHGVVDALSRARVMAQGKARRTRQADGPGAKQMEKRSSST